MGSAKFSLRGSKATVDRPAANGGATWSVVAVSHARLVSAHGTLQYVAPLFCEGLWIRTGVQDLRWVS